MCMTAAGLQQLIPEWIGQLLPLPEHLRETALPGSLSWTKDSGAGGMLVCLISSSRMQEAGWRRCGGQRTAEGAGGVLTVKGALPCHSLASGNRRQMMNLRELQ